MRLRSTCIGWPQAQRQAGRSVGAGVDAAPGAAQTFVCITPALDTPVGPQDWLTRTGIVGRGQRWRDPDHSVCNYYGVG